MSEPRFASGEWRWIDAKDGTHTLVEGEGLLPLPRVVLKCGDIDSEDQDRIAACHNALAGLAPKQVEAIPLLVEWFTIPACLGTVAQEEAWKKKWADLEELFPAREEGGEG